MKLELIFAPLHLFHKITKTFSLPFGVIFQTRKKNKTTVTHGQIQVYSDRYDLQV